MASRLDGSTISEQIRAAVDLSGQSRYAICQATGLDQAHLSRFMTGERALSQENIDRLCGHLGLQLARVPGRVRASKKQGR